MSGSKRSLVWTYFDKEGEVGKCRTCKKSVGCAKGNTSGLRSHLTHRHPILGLQLQKDEAALKAPPDPDADADDFDNEDASASSQPIRSPSVASTSSERSQSGLRSPSPPLTGGKSAQGTLDNFRPIDNKTKERLHRLVAYFIATSALPYSLVEKKGFRVMCNGLKPGYVPPGRRALTDNYVPKLYNEAKALIAGMLKNALYVAFSSDLWTSVARTPYCSLTAHFLDSNWQLHALTLRCRMLVVDHTGTNIRDFFQETTSEYSISLSQIACITTDNADNMRVAVVMLSANHVNCYAHTTQNGVEDMLKREDIEKVSRKSRKLQQYMHGEKVTRAFNKFTSEKHNKTVPELPGPCSTRWWTELDLYCAIDNNHLYLAEFLATHDKGKKFDMLPTAAEMKILRAVIRALKPIQEMATVMGSETYVTASAVLPLVYLLESGIGDDEQDASDQEGEGEREMEGEGDAEDLGEHGAEVDAPPSLKPADLRQFVVNKMMKRFDPSDDIPADTRAANIRRHAVRVHAVLAKCAFLDLRFRHDLRESDITAVGEDLISEHVDSSPNDNDGGSAQDQGQVVTAAGKRKGGFGAIFSKRQAAGHEQMDRAPKDVVSRELDRYLALPPLDKDSDVLLWWKAHEASFPCLAKLAKKYLCIPGTSIPSERLFSSAAHVITDLRSCLTGEHAEELIFLHMNRDIVPIPK